jgi:hypothetical protein
MVVGVAMGLLGLWMLVRDPAPPIPLSIAFLVVAAVEIATGLFTLKVVRIAWAFGSSLNGTAAVVFLFGAPKVRDALQVHIALALIPCLVFGAITVLLALGSVGDRS